jgi:MinD-like ATPase involved in chromosome partitioning or flagellar assembly
VEFTKICDAKKASVVEKLNALNDTERIMIINKYSRLTENIYCTFRAKENINIIIKIFLFKFDIDALVEAYVNGDPVVDHPGCTLNEFLNNEMAK